MKFVQANEVQVNDIIWKEQQYIVTEVRVLSVSTAITARLIDKPEGSGSVQWLYGNDWPAIPVTRKESN